MTDSGQAAQTALGEQKSCPWRAIAGAVLLFFVGSVIRADGSWSYVLGAALVVTAPVACLALVACLVVRRRRRP